MDDKIELKLLSKKYYWIINTLFLSFILLVISALVRELLMPNITNVNVFFDFCMISWCITIMILWWKYFLNAPSRIIVENDTIIVEKIYFKPITIPLVNIRYIRNTGFGERSLKGDGKESYAIDYDKKKLYLDCFLFQFAGVDLVSFITVLKVKVDVAKRNS